MAPSSTPNSRPGRYLTALVVLIVVMLAGVLGGRIFNPADWHKSFVVHLGLDLSSGTSVTLQAQTNKKGQVPGQASMTKAVQIITNRVEATGLTGASVVQQGKNQIVVSVPGAGAQKVATLVGETALLRLRQVLYVAPNTTTSTTTPTPPSPSASTSPTAKASAARARLRRARLVYDGQRDRRRRRAEPRRTVTAVRQAQLRGPAAGRADLRHQPRAPGTTPTCRPSAASSRDQRGCSTRSTPWRPRSSRART